MAWSDEPTDSQLEILYRMFRWNMGQEDARAAMNFLRDFATRREVSLEIGRVKKLYDEHSLTKESAFDSEIWSGYERS